ncbi:hypothetical protein [Candidatus Mycolicibacterium alkanivorans]|uniref:Uncharacterized protein n=1 Tax=Candidatus Mycolicibacterium alkanivorans TaxID=2954114 RepID=A0ABS9YU34_9MYCO|nr:hypothetical protein [Candidatus Mycolicibacterium alkanivorans]MCI4674313.1 hypothetical protein [Candidatus Mycolicibacterium alkanivorans]
MIGGGVAAGVARSQQPGQRFAAGDLGAVHSLEKSAIPANRSSGARSVFIAVMIPVPAQVTAQVTNVADVLRRTKTNNPVVVS